MVMDRGYLSSLGGVGQGLLAGFTAVGPCGCRWRFVALAALVRCGCCAERSGAGGEFLYMVFSRSMVVIAYLLRYSNTIRHCGLLGESIWKEN